MDGFMYGCQSIDLYYFVVTLGRPIGSPLTLLLLFVRPQRFPYPGAGGKPSGGMCI